MLHRQLPGQAGPAPDAERAACCLENVLPMVLGGQTLKDLLCLEAALQATPEAQGLSVVQGALVRCKLAGKYCWFQVQEALLQADGRSWQLVVGQVDQRRTLKPEFVHLEPRNKSEAGAQAELAELATRWHNMLSSRRQVARIQWMVEGGTDQLSKILKREGIPPGTGSFPVPAPALESLMTTLRNPKGPASRFPLIQPAAALPPAAAAGAWPGVAAPAPAPLAAAPAIAQQRQWQQQPLQQPLHQASMHTVPVAATALHGMPPLSQLHWAGSMGTGPPTSSARLAGLEGSAELAGPSAALPSHPLGAAAGGPGGDSGGVHSSVAGPAVAVTAAGLAALLKIVQAAGLAVGPAAAAAAVTPAPSISGSGELLGNRTGLPLAAPAAPAAVGPSSTPGTNAAPLDSAALHATAEADPLAFLAELKRDVADLMGSMGLDANGNPLQADASAAALGAGGRESAPAPGAIESAAAAQPGWRAHEGNLVPGAMEAAVQSQAEGALAGWSTVGIEQSHRGAGRVWQQQGGPGASHEPQPVGIPAESPNAGIKGSWWDAAPAVGASFPGLPAKQARAADLAEQGQRAGGAGAHGSITPQPAAAAVRHGEHGSGAAAMPGHSIGSGQSRGRTVDGEHHSSRSPSRQWSDSSWRHSGSHRQKSQSPSSRRSGSCHRHRSRSRSGGKRHHSRSRSRGRRHRSRSRPPRSMSWSRGKRHRQGSSSSSRGRRSYSRSRSRSGARRRSSRRHYRSRSRSGSERPYSRSRSRSGARRYRSRSRSGSKRPYSRSRSRSGARRYRSRRRSGSKRPYSRSRSRSGARRRHRSRSSSRHGRSRSRSREQLEYVGTLSSRVLRAIGDLCEHSHGILPLEAFDRRVVLRMEGLFGQRELPMLDFLDRLRSEMPQYVLKKPAAWIMHHLTCYMFEPNAGLGMLPRGVQGAIEDLCEREGRNLPLSSFDYKIVDRMLRELRTEQEMLRFLDYVEANLRPILRNPASWMMNLLTSYHNS